LGARLRDILIQGPTSLQSCGGLHFVVVVIIISLFLEVIIPILTFNMVTLLDRALRLFVLLGNKFLPCVRIP